MVGHAARKGTASRRHLGGQNGWDFMKKTNRTAGERKGRSERPV